MGVEVLEDVDVVEREDLNNGGMARRRGVQEERTFLAEERHFDLMLGQTRTFWCMWYV
jgi:hypothetical protein